MYFFIKRFTGFSEKQLNYKKNMPRHCCFCTLHSIKPVGSLLRFPNSKNSSLLKKLIKYIDETQYSEKIVLYSCEKHFEPQNIIQGFKSERLVSNS